MAPLVQCALPSLIGNWTMFLRKLQYCFSNLYLSAVSVAVNSGAIISITKRQRVCERSCILSARYSTIPSRHSATCSYGCRLDRRWVKQRNK